MRRSDDNSGLSYTGDSSASIRLSAKNTYARVHACDADEDAWHKFSTETIHLFIQDAIAGQELSELRILNGGAGGLSYGLDTGIHLDFSIASLRRSRRAVVSDIERLCIAPAVIDLAICVGSVINYASADTVLAELSEAIRPGGSLILEYERSESLALIFSGTFRSHAGKVTVSYKGYRHPMLVYSDRLMAKVLAAHGFNAERRMYFHIVPPGLFKGYARGIMSRLDKWFRNTPLLRKLASNCIVECRRS